MSLQKLIEKAKYDNDEMAKCGVPSAIAVMKICAAAEVLLNAGIILEHDADFFSGDVRKLTAWEGFLVAIKKADQICEGE